MSNTTNKANPNAIYGLYSFVLGILNMKSINNFIHYLTNEDAEL